MVKKTGFFLFSLYLITLPLSGYADEEGKIWKKLQKGGLVVLMRHASVNQGKEVGNPLLRDPSCLKERNLSDKGKREAARIGEKFVANNIPIESVLTSPYCRTIETAKIAFDRAQPVEFLSLLEALPEEKAEANSETLMRRIGSYSGKGNLVLITHRPNISAVTFEGIEKGAFLILKPAGGDKFEEIGKIELER